MERERERTERYSMRERETEPWSGLPTGTGGTVGFTLADSSNSTNIGRGCTMVRGWKATFANARLMHGTFSNEMACSGVSVRLSVATKHKDRSA